MLTITKKAEGRHLWLALKGRLDTTTAPQLDAALAGALDDVDALTLDFSGLEYLSSSGLRVLLSAQRTMNRQGSMKITHVNEAIQEIFDITGFSEILTLE